MFFFIHIKNGCLNFSQQCQAWLCIIASKAIVGCCIMVSCLPLLQPSVLLFCLFHCNSTTMFTFMSRLLILLSPRLKCRLLLLVFFNSKEQAVSCRWLLQLIMLKRMISSADLNEKWSVYEASRLEGSSTCRCTKDLQKGQVYVRGKVLKWKRKQHLLPAVLSEVRILSYALQPNEQLNQAIHSHKLLI